MKKILFVHENHKAGMDLENEMSRLGYAVARCVRYREVAARIRTGRPDLVVLMIQMRGYGGLTLLSEIRKTWYDLPVVVWTGGYDSLRCDPRLLAADYVVRKLADRKDLVRKISMALETEAAWPIPLRSGPAAWDVRGRSLRGPENGL
ncbi:MAG: response regulator [Proteobacteria bacterium]|nr:response regulator [Pseudomonadota bacterium]